MKRKLSILSMMMLTLAGCNKTTDDIYLIPEGYEGYIYVFFNVKGAPPLTQEGKFDVYPINEEGYFATSTPDMDYGTVTDKYYYVNKRGEKTKIPTDCVHGISNGSYEDSNPNQPIHIIMNKIQITKNDCGPDFLAWGKEMDEQEHFDKVLAKVLKNYYEVD